MRFLVAFKKEDKNLVKIDFGGDIGEKWATTTDAVYNFAKSNIKGSNRDTNFSGEEVTVEYKVNDGKYEVSRITKVAQSETTKKTKDTPTEPICKDCGATLKDAKYEKCYTCNKKNPVKKTYGKTPEEIESIKKQAVLKACCHAIQVLTGRIEDAQTLGDMIVELFDKLYAKISK